MLLGMAGLAWLLPHPRKLGAVGFDVQTLLFAAVGVVVGFQAVLFWFLTKVYAINEDESKAVALNAFTAAFVKGIFQSKVQGQPIDVPLSDLQLRDMDLPCRACEYSLNGLPLEGKCPECGQAYSKRELLKG